MLKIRLKLGLLQGLKKKTKKFIAQTFSSVLFNSPNPLAEPMPTNDWSINKDDDFMIALWSICREITHDVLFQSKIRSHTKPKPWSKERFVPVSKFTKGETYFFILLALFLNLS